MFGHNSISRRTSVGSRKRIITIRKIHVTTTICYQRTVRGVSKQDIGQTASQPPATICEPRLLTGYTYGNRRIHVGAVTRRQCRASRTQAGH